MLENKLLTCFATKSITCDSLILLSERFTTQAIGTSPASSSGNLQQSSFKLSVAKINIKESITNNNVVISWRESAERKVLNFFFFFFFDSLKIHDFFFHSILYSILINLNYMAQTHHFEILFCIIHSNYFPSKSISNIDQCHKFPIRFRVCREI